MGTGLTFQAAFWTFVGQTVAFSIGLLLLGKPTNRILLWLLANALGIIGVVQMGGDALLASPFGVIFNLAAVLLRSVAVGTGSLWSRRNRRGTIVASLSMLAILLLVPLGNTNLRGLLVVTASITALLASIFYLAADRRSHGLAGTWQMQGISIILIAAMATQIAYVYPIGEAGQLFNSPQRTAAGATLLVLLGAAWQIAFFSLVTGRNAREKLVASRRTGRLREKAHLLKTRLSLTQELAKERLNLLRLMSHEVRQPLNNAQAALQTLILNSSRRVAGPANNVEVATRIQGILDDVILAISNSIIAASIIEWRRNPAMLPVEAGETLELAALDCAPEETARIKFTRPPDEAFPSADPALLRLALRNLLSNALKYSPPDSAVQALMLIDDKRQGVAFQITNTVADTASLHGDLFERGVRGGAEAIEGAGLGLFMVSETSRLHRGGISCWQLTPAHVTFELFIPL